ncbi:PKD domain-containing protein [Candidatus Falkowbacteria bacterium]|nr:PKD domain-containing protein [Candidatus Falkowbacteria bacterium]
MKTKGGEIFLLLILVILSNFFCIRFSKAVSSVVFSEICWMGSAESSSDEWIELFNPTLEDIDLTGWIIQAYDGQPEIALEGIITAQGYFLLERTDDDSSPALADIIYSGSLGNSGEILELLNEDDVLVDSISAEEGWPAGDNETKQTMALANGLWKNSEQAGGSPKAENKITEEEEEEQDASSDPVSDEDVVIKKKEGKLIINEIYPNPVGSDRESEFVEIKNTGETAIDLTGWIIDVDGKTYEFGRLDALQSPAFNKTLRTGGHLAIYRKQSRLVLNNSGSEIKLYKPGKRTPEDILSYKDAPVGYVYVNSESIDLEKISSSTKEFFFNSTKIGGWVWSSQISPGANNQIKAKNTPPKASFSVPEEIEPKQEVFFDASDTYDEEGDELEYFWDFGDGVKVGLEEARHTFMEPGEYEIVLQASDGRENSIVSKIIKVSGMVKDPQEEVLEIYEDDEPFWFEELEAISHYPVMNGILSEEKKLSIKDAVKNIGQEAVIRGIVLVEPGILGTQYFYLADQEAGIRIYNYKKDFPRIEEGDEVEVRGEIVELRSETTLKTDTLDDMTVLSKGNELPVKKISSEDIIKDNIGRLLQVQGRISKKDPPRIYMNDGFGEIILYLKPNLDIGTKDIEEDSELKVKGVLGVVSGDLVLLPRKQSDIEANELLIKEDKGEVLGKNEENTQEWDLPARKKTGVLWKYAIMIAATSALITIIYIYQRKRTEA